MVQAGQSCITFWLVGTIYWIQCNNRLCYQHGDGTLWCNSIESIDSTVTQVSGWCSINIFCYTFDACYTSGSMFWVALMQASALRSTTMCCCRDFIPISREITDHSDIMGGTGGPLDLQPCPAALRPGVSHQHQYYTRDNRWDTKLILLLLLGKRLKSLVVSMITFWPCGWFIQM